MERRTSPSFVAGVLAGGALCSVFSPQRGVTQPRRHQGEESRKAPANRPAALRDGGDLAAPGALARVLQLRASADGEIIFMLTDQHHERLALNLLLNLGELGLHHHLTIASSSEVCDSLWRRSRGLGLSLGCGRSTFLRRGVSAAWDAGLDAYGLDDDHVYHLWWQRWFFLSEAVGLGYRVLSLDTDVSLRASPYPLIHGPLAHHELLTGLDTDKTNPTTSFYFPQINVGFVYARGPPGGAGHAVLLSTRRRLERILAGEIIALPSSPKGQMSLWDQDTFKDALETAAFTPEAVSYRHSRLHAEARDGGLPPHKRAASLPAGWGWRVEHVRFFPSYDPLPSAWLQLATAATDISTLASTSADAASGDKAPTSGAAAPMSGAAAAGGRTATFGAVPLWLFSSYLLCPHGAVCDGRWAWSPPPVLIGHVVGSKAKFWLMRLLGWWHYGAARPPRPLRPPRQPLAAATPASSAGVAGLAADAEHAAAAADADDGNDDEQQGFDPSTTVFPRATVRPLVLRGVHGLHIPYTPRSHDGSGVKALRQELIRWALLAVALGRRAVLPMVPCEIPVPETPDRLRKSTVVVKLADTALCNASTRQAAWRMPPTVAAETSPLRLRRTREMWAFSDYSAVTPWPPKRAPSCCQLLPALRCIDQYGNAGELSDELLLNERDLAWVDAEEARSLRGVNRRPRSEAAGRGGGTRVIRTTERLTLEAMAQWEEVRTLVVDVEAAGMESGELAARLPEMESIVAEVRRRLESQVERPSRGERRCWEQLLESVPK